MPTSTPAPDPAETSTPTKSGITFTADGQRVIPSSLRPDGSTRREIRVRPGYRPPEDVEVYKNRTAEAWKNRGGGGVPGASSLSDDDKKQPAVTPATNKNAKRKAARKRAKEKATSGQPETDGGITGSDEKTNESQKYDPPSTAPTAGDSGLEQTKTEQTPDEREKLAKAIRKKIRQANELKIRKEVGGESLLPEQLEKVIKLQELTRQLSALGFDQ